MEDIHKPSLRPWICELINVKNFRDSYSASISEISKAETKDVFNLGDKEFAALEEECGMSSLKCPAQQRMELKKQIEIPDDTKLETLRLQKADLTKRETDKAYFTYTYHVLKHHNYPTYKTLSGLELVATKNTTPPVAKVNEPDVVLYVLLFRPEKKSDCYSRGSVSRTPVYQIDQEMMVLGSQFLTELRDKIECISDKGIRGEFSDQPECQPTITFKDMYKSGFFFINNTFYNDMRDSTCKDYSKVIIDWAKNSSRGLGSFRKAKMENTKFIDLDIQLGYPYVYTHQGECEHIFVFYDLQLFGQHHINNRGEYPVRVTARPKKRLLCMICQLHTTEWITFDNMNVTENPFFFCDICFNSYNYDEDGNKLGNFRAYHYCDRSNIL